MELRVFDTTIEPLGAIDELASLLWHTKYFDVGTFSLLAPITDNNSKLLKRGNIIVKHDGKQELKTADGSTWRRAAQITYVHITKDENGLEQLEAQGYIAYHLTPYTTARHTTGYIKPRTGRGTLPHSLQTVFSPSPATGCK